MKNIYQLQYYRDLYQPLQTFESVGQMHAAVNQYIQKHVFQLTPSTIKLLKFLSVNSRHVFGVSWMKLQTIADKLNISLKTAQRAIKSLEDLHIIKKHRNQDLAGKRFILVICNDLPNDQLNDRLKTEEKTQNSLDTTEVSEDHKGDLTLSFNKDKESNNTNKNVVYVSNTKLIRKFLLKDVPLEFQNIVSGLSAHETKELWQRVWVCTKACGLRKPVMDIVQDAWKTVKQMMKKNKIEKDLNSLYYGILRNKYRDFEVHIRMDQNYNEHLQHFFKSVI